MKKIISALTLGAMVAGAAFADVSIALNYRQRANLLSHNFKQGGTDATSKILFLDAYSGNGTDNLAIGLSGDIVAFNAQLVTDQANESLIRSKSFNGNLNLGKLQVFAGVWSDGKANGAFRNKTDIDAGNMEGMDFEWKKLGSGFKNSPSNFVNNIVMGLNNNNEDYAIGAQISLPGTKSFKWYAQGTYITNSKSDESNYGNNNQLKGHAVVGLVNMRMAPGTAEVMFKYGDAGRKNSDGEGVSAMAFGAYFMPVTIDNLTTTIGGAGSVIDGVFTDWSADLRLYYKAGKVSFSSFHSFSMIVDGEKAADVGMKNDGIKGIADSKAFTNGKHGGSALKRDMLLANNLMVRAKFNKSFAMYGFVADMVGMGTNMGADTTDDNAAWVQLRAGLYGQVYCGSNSISMGAVYSMDNVTKVGDKDPFSALAIPVIFRVKM